MSTAPTTYEQEPEGPNAPKQDATPRPPIVLFRSGTPHIDVFLSVEDANEAARAGLEGEYYDVRGIVLTRVESEDGSSELEAQGEGDPDGLRRRVTAELRSAAEQAAPDEVDEVEAIRRWLEAAPTLEYMLQAMAFGQATRGVEFLDGIRCHRCNVFEKFFRNDCCPGG